MTMYSDYQRAIPQRGELHDYLEHYHEDEDYVQALAKMNEEEE